MCLITVVLDFAPSIVQSITGGPGHFFILGSLTSMGRMIHLPLTIEIRIIKSNQAYL